MRGTIFCEESIPDSEEVFMSTNYLTLPLETPTELPTCDNKVVYSTNTNHCAVATLSTLSDGMPRQSERLLYSKKYALYSKKYEQPISSQPISSRDRYLSTNSKNAFQSRVNRFNHSVTADEKHLQKPFQDSKVKEKDFNFSHSLFHLNESGYFLKLQQGGSELDNCKIYITCITDILV